MWQTPVLGITAQSFLYTIAFDSDNNIGDKIFASVLIFILGTATIQLLLKHRYHEVLTSKKLLEIEADNDLKQIHNKPDKVDRKGRWKIEYWLLKQSSFRVWIFALGITTCSFFIPLVSHFLCKDKLTNKTECISKDKTCNEDRN